ncbi:MAG: hypothetical protein A3F11_10925 [Gammaproteobacteria bacterium RIFCSPHIGHO2_12_FULL_37_14]|nr:MAG: hypothetical protein A3F11_10925 [Gammaproteobacteria bacterium RIFCSPHIGHO2_12_FULL_37_14]
MKHIDLSRHSSIINTNTVNKIIKPLSDAFNVTHFCYLKLYTDGSRLLLSNDPDCVRFMYEEGKYKQMWLDGERPELLHEGWHSWDVLKNTNRDKGALEKEINHLFNLYHGMSFIKRGQSFFEIYTFDTATPEIYLADKRLLKHFILYFKEQAKKIIDSAEHEKIKIPLSKPLFEKMNDQHHNEFIEFTRNTQLNRYYLGGSYGDEYLTPKQMQCTYWLIHGKSFQEIGTLVGITEKTVDHYIQAIKKKLKCNTRVQLVKAILESDVLFSCVMQSFNAKLRAN